MKLPLWPVALTAGLLAARVAAVPALSDPVNGAMDGRFRLVTPWLYVVFAPLFTLWDGVSMLSMSRLRGFLVGLLVLYVVWRIVRGVWRGTSWRRELGVLALSVLLFAVFLIAGALWHRPMLALAGAAPNELVVDFHSHTNVSHDVHNTQMRGFDTEANRRWHRRAGFDALFITDHNTVDGLAAADRPRRTTPPYVCPGIEVSAWRAHIVLLGDSTPVDRRRYNTSLDALLTLLRISDSTYGALSVASIPEYERHHWDRLDQLVTAGLDGFEIVNAAPKANELTQPRRDSVIALARRHNRFVLGVSDSHGWGATSMVWNVVRVPSAPNSATEACHAILAQLRQGFATVRILERHRLRPDAWWPQWLTPIGVLWETWRGMGWLLTLSWLAWIWIVWRISRRNAGRKTASERKPA